MSRRGVALVAVLWTLTLLTGVVGAAVLAVKTGQRAAWNRVLLMRGRWAAEACLAIAQARWAEARLAARDSVDLGRTTRCAWRVDDPTERLNVNRAGAEELLALLAALGMAPDTARVFVRALRDQRRRGELTDVGLLEALPGFDARLSPHVTADGPGVVNAEAAPAVVLSALPGLTPEAVDYLLARRAVGRPVPSLDELAAGLSPPARAVLLEHYAALATVLVFRAPQLVITGKGWVASSGDNPRARVELLVVPLPERLAVLRRRVE